MKLLFRLAITVLVLGVAVSAFAAEHPAYLHALSDLRAARWMIDHVPGKWVRIHDEIDAVRKIDAAINEIKRASIDDGKDLNWHPAADEKPDHRGRLHDAVELLRKARADIEKEEDNGLAKGLRNRANRHIEDAIHFTEAAIRTL